MLLSPLSFAGTNVTRAGTPCTTLWKTVSQYSLGLPLLNPLLPLLIQTLRPVCLAYASPMAIWKRLFPMPHETSGCTQSVEGGCGSEGASQSPGTTEPDIVILTEKENKDVACGTRSATDLCPFRSPVQQ